MFGAEALSALVNYSGVRLIKGEITSLKEVSQELVNLIAQEFDLETKS